MAPFLVSFICQLDTAQSHLSESQVQDRPGQTGLRSGLCRTVLTDDGCRSVHSTVDAIIPAGLGCIRELVE